jgi:sugar transferase (PEP-CTERM/EpsH1 system associated)
MSNLLYLAHRIPFPPNKGDKIRSYHTLKYLSGSHRVFLGAFVDNPDDWQYKDELTELCEEVYLCPLNPVYARFRSINGLFDNSPLTLPYYNDSRMREWVDNIVREYDIRNIYVFSSSMAQYVEEPDLAKITSVLDMVDVDSDKWRQYASTKHWLVRWIYAREAFFLQKYEMKIANLFNVITFVSNHEASFFRGIYPECRSKISWFNNGVDCDYFSPDRAYPEVYESGKKILVFTGAMDYWANADAVIWFVKEVFNQVHSAVTESQFYIVGAKPGKAVRQLSELPGVIVTGSVADVRPYLAQANLSVAPLRIARGVQNKVLEAMSMGLPVVATNAAVEGILPSTREQIMVCDDARVMCETIITTLNENRHSGKNRTIRNSVLNEYGWDTNLSELDGYYAP